MCVGIKHNFEIRLSCFVRRLLAGKTCEAENSQFQPDLLPLFVYYTPLPSNGLQLDAQETNRTYLFVTSLDTQQDRAKRSFDYGMLNHKFIIESVVQTIFLNSIYRTTAGSDMVSSRFSLE
jgi:hypothetical protein